MQMVAVLEDEIVVGEAARGYQTKPHTKMRTHPPTPKLINFTATYYSTTSIFFPPLSSYG
jgi:hypothetical protein